MSDQLVAGERVDLLLEALTHLKWTTGADGMAHGSCVLEPRLGEPFVRAQMRVEAELLRNDADALGGPNAENRTYEQRAADALLALVFRVLDAL
jgi:hypothetical protein